ncbi:XdhC family protein [Peribacillus sp. TH24]|nr:XdhC family protein [Peribacillus sp. TH24]
MTHSFQRDSHILKELIPYRPRYLGALGPRRRTERLLSSHSLPEWVYSPVGLNIHAEGPDEIAISIVAQLLQVRNETKKALCPEKVKI